MSYIGSTPTTQSFIAGTDYFNGTGAQVVFTLSRSVNSVNDIEVIVNNVEQIPSGYSVSGTTLTFSAAPSAGTSNVYVRYLSTTNLSLAIPAGTSASFNTVTATNLTATNLTSTNGASIQGLTVGRGAGAVATNTAVGASALAANTTGTFNTAVGFNALIANTTGEYNHAFGRLALASVTTGARNFGFGAGALQSVVSNNDNTAFGRQSLNSTVANDNSGFGNYTLLSNTTGANNTALGTSALQSNTTASNNTAVGYTAGYTITTGGLNTLIGTQAGYSLTTGVSNTIIGYGSGYLSTGSYNTFVGCRNALNSGVGQAMTTGSKNTILGGFDGNQGGLDIRTASNYIVLSDGDGNPRGIFDSEGNFLVGTTSAANSPSNGVNIFAGSTGQITIGHVVGTPNAYYYLNFAYNGSAIGNITQSGTTAVAYNTTSDYRLKENVQPIYGALARIAALKPCTYTWKSAPDEIGEGFIAHELAEVCPQAVTGEKDAMNEDGSIKAQSIDTSFLVATLTAAIKELKAEFDAYKATHP